MSKYEKAMKLIEERCGNGKDIDIALATMSLSSNTTGNPRPAVRMVCAYYEDGVFYVSTDAQKNKMLQIEKNNEVSVCGFGWYSFQATAESLGWVKDEKMQKSEQNLRKSSNGSMKLVTKTIRTQLFCVFLLQKVYLLTTIKNMVNGSMKLILLIKRRSK